MALGSQNNAVRKTFKKEIAGKSDWKSVVVSQTAAVTMLTTIKSNLAKDPNGGYLLAAYCQRQVNTLEDYIANGKTQTLKEYLRGKER